MATLFEEHFDGASSGTAITNLNSSFVSVSPQPNGTIQFSNVQAHFGAQSGRWDVATTATTPTAHIDFGSALNLIYYRAYLWLDNMPPAASHTIITMTNTNTRQADLRLISNGTSATISMRNLNTQVGITTSTVGAAEWFRVEWKVDKTNSTQEVRLFKGVDVDSPVASYTDHATGSYTQIAPDGTNQGILSPAQVNRYYFDEIKGDSNDWVGPITVIPSAVLITNTVLTVGP